MIGKGAFAKVCLGIQILTGAKVAMKIIEKSTLKSESAKKRLLLVNNAIIIRKLQLWKFYLNINSLRNYMKYLKLKNKYIS